MIGLRQSRRIMGEDPMAVAVAEGSFPMNKETRRLLMKGGRNGKMDPKNQDWDYFPDNKPEKRTSCMISMQELKNDIKMMTELAQSEEENENQASTHCLLHTDQLKALANFKCHTCEKKKEDVRQELKLKTFGMATAIHLVCSGCHEERVLPPRSSSFAGRGLDGEPSARSNNAWYETNLRLVLASLAVDNGGTDLSDIAAFIGLPQATSFGKRPFNRIECLVGETIRQVADDSMKEALDEEIENTLRDEGKNYEEWKQQDAANKKEVALTTSFDMGWGRRDLLAPSTILSPVMRS